MIIMTFDTHESVKKLKAIGFTEEQAETQTKIIADLVEEPLSPKRDFKEIEVALHRDMKNLAATLQNEIQQLTNDLTIRLGSMMVVTFMVVVALVKLL